MVGPVAAQDDRSDKIQSLSPKTASLMDTTKSTPEVSSAKVIASAYRDGGSSYVDRVPTSSAVEDLAVWKKLSLTKTYSIGTDDVLAIEVQNIWRDYVVLDDGSIDFPLIRGKLFVAGKTGEEVKDDLEQLVKIYLKPRIEVAVRDRGSHTVLVTGLVDAPGSHQLQRDAVPLFVICATASMNPKAKKVKITRSHGKGVEMYSFADILTDDIYVFPGDMIEFL